MKRDNLKTDQYFKEYIDYQVSQIKEFTDLKNGCDEKNIRQRDRYNLYLSNMYKDLLSAEYSEGESASKLKVVFEHYLSIIKECGIKSYDDTIDVLSLSILFEVRYDQIKLMINDEYIDKLIDLLIGFLKDGKIDNLTGDLKYPNYYQPFYNYAVGEISFEKFSNYMKVDWYKTNNEKAWYNSHLSKNDTYVGYWCWLAAALMKIRGDKVEKMEYVPVDLI